MHKLHAILIPIAIMVLTTNRVNAVCCLGEHEIRPLIVFRSDIYPNNHLSLEINVNQKNMHERSASRRNLLRMWEM